MNGKELEAMRLRLGLTRRDLAAAVGCSIIHIRLVERGHRPLSTRSALHGRLEALDAMSREQFDVLVQNAMAADLVEARKAREEVRHA